jgi:hypothetical protein
MPTYYGVLKLKPLRKTAYTFYPTDRCRKKGSFDLEKSDIVSRRVLDRVPCPGESRLRDYEEIEVRADFVPDILGEEE